MKEQKLIYWGLYEYNKELYVAIPGKQDDFFNDPNAIFAKVYDITKSYVVVKSQGYNSSKIFISKNDISNL